MNTKFLTCYQIKTISFFINKIKRHTTNGRKFSESVENKFVIFPASVKSKVFELERKVKDYKKYQEKHELCTPYIIEILPIDNQEVDIYDFLNTDQFFTIDSEESWFKKNWLIRKHQF